jgi:hypothetical protein
LLLSLLPPLGEAGPSSTSSEEGDPKKSRRKSKKGIKITKAEI